MRFSLIALYLLPLIVISGSTYNHHYSTDRQYSSSPGEMCKLTITKPNGEYKEALVNCNLISSFIWDAATKPNDQHVKNTTKVTVNSNGNSLVNSSPEALRLSTFPPIFSNTNSAKVRHNFNQHHHILKNGSKPYYMDLHEFASSANLRHKDQHDMKSGSNSDYELRNENNRSASGLAGNGNRRLAGWPQEPEITLKNGSKPYYMDLHELASRANLRHKDQHNAKSGSNSDNEPQNENYKSVLASNGNRRLVGWPQARQHKFTLRHKDQHNAKSGSNSDNEPQNENNSSGLAGSANRLLVGRSQAHQNKFILRHKDQHNAKSGSSSDNELRNENKKSGLAGNANRRLARRLQAPEFNLKNGSKPYYMDLHELASRANLRHKDQHNAKSRSNSDSEPQNENNSSGLAGSANRRLAGWPQTHELTLKNGSKPYYMDLHEVALKNGIKNYN